MKPWEENKEIFFKGGRKGGLISAKSQNRRSKNEKLFYEMCKSYFKEVKHNQPIFNGWGADIIIEDLKIAILWNGIWHYKQIVENQNLNQIQNRDKLKIKAYIIKDMGKYNPLFVKEEFDKFIGGIS